MSKTIYDLDLHETLQISGNNTALTSVTRVPGGWIYDTSINAATGYAISSVFVPLNTEFVDENKDKDKGVDPSTYAGAFV